MCVREHSIMHCWDRVCVREHSIIHCWERVCVREHSIMHGWDTVCVREHSCLTVGTPLRVMCVVLCHESPRELVSSGW